MKKCKKCGFVVTNEENVCSNCNSALLDRIEYIYICDKCATEFSDDDMICPNCKSEYNLLINSNKNEIEDYSINDNNIYENEIIENVEQDEKREVVESINENVTVDNSDIVQPDKIDENIEEREISEPVNETEAGISIEEEKPIETQETTDNINYIITNESTQNIKNNKTVTDKNKNKKENLKILELLKNKIVLGAGISLIILICSINFISNSKEDKVLKSENIVQNVSVNKKSDKTTYENNSSLKFNNAQKLLSDKNINGKVIGCSSDNVIKSTVALYQENDSFNFIVYDASRDRTAVIPYLSVMGNILNRNSIKFELYIDNDDETNDMQAGSTWNNTHIIPVYAEYTVDAKHKVKPGMIMTRSGEYGQYDKYLYSQANVDLINLFLTQAGECIENSISNNQRLATKLHYNDKSIKNKDDFKLAIITGSDVFLREQPSTNSKIITTLNKNTNVKVWGERKSDNSKNSYILKADKYMATDLTNNTPILLKKGIALKYVGRGKHGRESAICLIQVNGKNRKIEMKTGWGSNKSNIVESTKNNDWFNVELNNGRKGWVYGEFIKFR